MSQTIEKPKGQPVLIWNVPEKVKTEFKAACARNGVPMRQAVIQLMRKYVKCQ